MGSSQSSSSLLLLLLALLLLLLYYITLYYILFHFDQTGWAPGTLSAPACKYLPNPIYIKKNVRKEKLQLNKPRINCLEFIRVEQRIICVRVRRRHNVTNK